MAVMIALYSPDGSSNGTMSIPRASSGPFAIRHVDHGWGDRAVWLPFCWNAVLAL